MASPCLAGQTSCRRWACDRQCNVGLGQPAKSPVPSNLPGNGGGRPCVWQATARSYDQGCAERRCPVQAGLERHQISEQAQQPAAMRAALRFI